MVTTIPVSAINVKDRVMKESKFSFNNNEL